MLISWRLSYSFNAYYNLYPSYTKDYVPLLGYYIFLSKFVCLGTLEWLLGIILREIYLFGWWWCK